VLGIGFYLITATFIQDETTLRKSLRWIYLGGLIAILTSFVQAAAWQVYGQYPQFLWKLQSLFLFEWLALPAARNWCSFRAFMAGASAQHALHSAVVRVQRQKYFRFRKSAFLVF